MFFTLCYKYVNLKLYNMKKLFGYLKCRITGHYNKIRTGKCGLHLYYDGCGCDDCNKQQQIESDKLGVSINNFSSKSS